MLNNTTSLDISALAIEAIQNRKGHDITILDLSEIETAAASSFIICQGNSPTQVAAIADSVRESLLERAGVKPFNYDGYRNSTWIVLDYGHIMIHIFVPEMRDRYNLEELWLDAPSSQIPNLD